MFEVPLPGAEQVRRLLKVTLSSLDTALDINWDRLVESLLGQSAANVVNAAQNAAKSAVLSSQLPITQSDLDKAVKEIINSN